MHLGRLDVCLSVASAKESCVFYNQLGFETFESGEGWAVVANEGCRLGLFEPHFMDGRAFSLNFRGGHIGELAASLDERGIETLAAPRVRDGGAGSVSLVDPDGHLLFFDSTAAEVDAARRRAES